MWRRRFALGRARVGAVTWAAVIGIVVGSALAVAVNELGVPHRPSSTVATVITPVVDPAAAAEFLDTWQRSRAVSYVADSRFTRTVGEQTALSADGRVARRPPEWLVRQGGSWQGLLHGQRFDCNNALDDQMRCAIAADDVDYQAEVAGEVTAFRSWITGTEPDYEVSRDGQCFQLRRIRPVLAPPLGDESRYCFDERDIPTSTSIRTGAATDTEVLIGARTEVADEDLTPPVEPARSR
jgi:hypothetical protein